MRRLWPLAGGGMLARLMSQARPETPFAELLGGVSRTFALSIAELPRPLDAWVTSAYLLCRVVDTVEDRADTTESDRQGMFDDLLAAIGPPVNADRCLRLMERFGGRGQDDPCTQLMHRCGQVLVQVTTYPAGVVDAIRRCAVEMIDGLRRTPLSPTGAGPRFVCTTLEDLERYCHYAAGVVGMMLARLFDLHLGLDPASISDARFEQARRFGRGLQLTNIVKDHPADLADGRVFIPPEAATRCGLAPETLLRPALPLPVRRLIVARAADHLDQALEYTLAYPADATGIRLFCLQPLMMALLTLGRVLTHMDVTPDDRPKITREQVGDVMATSRRMVRDDVAIRRWYGAHREVLAAEMG